MSAFALDLFPYACGFLGIWLVCIHAGVFE